MSEATAFMITSMLQDVALVGGTPYNVACKTGTTNYDESTHNSMGLPYDAVRDSWVVGYSTQTTIGMWYGYDNITRESVAQGYVLHQTPAAIQKDRLFLALVYSGAMEGDRAGFSQPGSVSKVAVSPNSNPPKLAIPGQEAVYEYFKKGTEPTEYDFSHYRLPAPSNLTISDKDGKVTLSWGAVSPGDLATGDHGTFGYNVYKDGVLVTWTDKTSYTYTPSDGVYGTYKVIATYKSYNDIQSNAAEKKYTKAPEITCPSDATVSNNTCVCTDTNKEYDATSKTCKEKQQNNENENE